MTGDKIKEVMDACYLAKRVRDMLPKLPNGVTFSHIHYLDTIRRLESSRSPLIFVAVACVVNIIGDLILVAGFHLDAAGAAIATVAAQAVSVVLAIVLLKKKDLKFGIQKKDFRINGQCKRFLKVGLPLAYVMSIQPHASLTKIGLVAPVATCFGIVLNVIFYLIFTRKMEWERKNKKLL